ncbi:GRB2-associated-binding protein 3 isoform X1 [Ictalurus punctatus]|uniref:GRB2-associated-binding protein 3 isoform X1 n=2 Tax=Ictalurus punctatus TaxID=7998 RepID=A0A9F7RA84_ICTPU|nr:GRB2-associated-binding protein 3 isoform X1 [Ictalurus punctatus]
MSAGDVVCTGWLVKSPPEKKLKRYAWRKRWFVLRRGRMSGDPDVLEYFRSKTSRKPIRSIDLQECEVAAEAESGRELEWGAWSVKRHLANQHLFIVKTSTRVFYLLAKTAEEMNCWVRNIGQICTFSTFNHSTESMDSLAQTPSSHQPSPVLSTHAPFSANQEAAVTETDSAVRDEPSESDTSIPLDYLFLSQCETGRKSITRCDSMSNSERSFEQSSLENVTDDVFGPGVCLDSAPSPFGAAYGTRPLSSCPIRGPGDVFRFDSPFCATPPPLPPKPTHMSDHHCHEDAVHNQGQLGLLPRRTSLSGGEHFRRGEFEFSARGNWNKRLSLNLPRLLVNTPSESQSDDSSYVPMASPPISSSDIEVDGYIPMSPTTLPVPLLANGKPESPLPPTPDMDPPPINRSLKPRRRVKPPPLDLSTISECPTHLPLIRTMTEPSASPRCVPWDRGRGLNSTEQEGNDTPTSFFSACDSAPWFRSSHLDYLSLDFNSASPSPVQKKPPLDEQRVDYVQVDEKKTQALQNTRTEWKDSRQPKV